MCAKYSDFLCIWLRKCDFLTEKLGIKFIPDLDWPDPDPKWYIPDPDPAKSSGSDRIRIHNTAGRHDKYKVQYPVHYNYKYATDLSYKYYEKNISSSNTVLRNCKEKSTAVEE
jgi:hypothetical protein